MYRTIFATLILIAATSAMATEEPAYKVIGTIDAVELREYSPYVVAEVLISGDANDASNAAFPILAGYIFGKNKGQKRFAMTAPVTQSAKPIKLKMTAPVTQTATSGGYAVQFVLPRTVTLESAPEPLDPRVMLRQVPMQRVAVIRFSGFWSDANYQENLTKLQQSLRKSNEPWQGDPMYARYDAPFTPWFMRRNEIWLQIRP